MDTFMSSDITSTQNQASTYGEYPVTKSMKRAEDTSIPTSGDAFPSSTEGLAQYETTTNELNTDTQFNITSENQTTDIQTETNYFGESNDFASVNVLQSDENSNVQVGEYPATSSNTNVDFTTSTEVNSGFETNTQANFGTTNTEFEATTTNYEGMDVLQASGTNGETQYGEYQTTSPIIDTPESAQIIGNFEGTETNT